MKTKRFFLSLLFSVINAAAYNVLGQSILYEEYFDNNNRNWLTGENAFCIAKVKNGKYYLECKGYLTNGHGAFNTAPGLTLPATDFSISCDVKWIKNRRTDGTYYPFGFKLEDFYFFLYAFGDRRLLHYDGSKYNTLVDWGQSNAILTGNAINKVRLEFRSGKVYFYVNETLLYDKPINFKGGTLSFFVENSEIVEFDNLVVKKLAPSASKQPVTKEEFKQQVENEVNKNSGYDDLDLLFKTPTQQLIHTFTKYGITMKVNPMWTSNTKNVVGSRISLYGDELKKMQSTFPELADFPSKFAVTLALNPGTIETKKQQVVNLIYNEFWKYLNVNGKDLSPDEWKSKWVKTLIKSEYFTTAEGRKGEIYMFNYPTVIYNEPGSKTADVHSAYRVYYMIQQPDDKIIQCTVEFEKAKYGVNKPLPEDITSFKGLNSEDEQKCMDFLKAMFKTITAPK